VLEGLEPWQREIYLDRIRAMTPTEKLMQMDALNEMVRATQRAAIRHMHPEATEYEIKMRLASRWVKDPALLKELCGWDVEEMGY
jgi:hypothetical protein